MSPLFWIIGWVFVPGTVYILWREGIFYKFIAFAWACWCALLDILCQLWIDVTGLFKRRKKTELDITEKFWHELD